MKNQLTRNFTLEELLKSDTADRWGFKEQYTPPENVIENLKDLCVYILQPLRDELKLPIRISSGYRCPRVNAKIGGASRMINGKVTQTSDHVLGRAADISVVINGVRANQELVKTLSKMIKSSTFEWDQIILENGSLANPSWIHISYRKGENRKQILRKEPNVRGYKTIKI
jgi:hypothetical protein